MREKEEHLRRIIYIYTYDAHYYYYYYTHAEKKGRFKGKVSKPRGGILETVCTTADSTNQMYEKIQVSRHE